MVSEDWMEGMVFTVGIDIGEKEDTGLGAVIVPRGEDTKDSGASGGGEEGGTGSWGAISSSVTIRGMDGGRI